MRDRIVLITGGSSGVGRAAAAGLARLGARTVLLSRDGQRAAQTRRELAEATGSNSIEVLQADLSDPGSVRRAAEQFRQRHDRLHVLMNCAGVLYPRRTLNGAGVEMTLAVEFLGHFLLTNLLLPMLMAGAPARILTVTGNSAPLRFARLDFENLQLASGYNPLRAKLRAELAKALFSHELARRLEGSGVSSNCFHPGLIRSGLTRNLPWILRLPASLGMALLRREARTGVYLASAPEVEGVTGKFFEGIGDVRSLELDPGQARRLWEIAESLTGLAQD